MGNACDAGDIQKCKIDKVVYRITKFTGGLILKRNPKGIFMWKTYISLWIGVT